MCGILLTHVIRPEGDRLVPMKQNKRLHPLLTNDAAAPLLQVKRGWVGAARFGFRIGDFDWLVTYQQKLLVGHQQFAGREPDVKNQTENEQELKKKKIADDRTSKIAS